MFNNRYKDTSGRPQYTGPESLPPSDPANSPFGQGLNGSGVAPHTPSEGVTGPVAPPQADPSIATKILANAAIANAVLDASIQWVGDAIMEVLPPLYWSGESSAIESAAWNPIEEEVTISMVSGDVLIYPCSKDQWVAFIGSPSKGAAFNSLFKGT